jgi:hypothetical protein
MCICACSCGVSQKTKRGWKEGKEKKTNIFLLSRKAPTFHFCKNKTPQISALKINSCKCVNKKKKKQEKINQLKYP